MPRLDDFFSLLFPEIPTDFDLGLHFSFFSLSLSLVILSSLPLTSLCLSFFPYSISLPFILQNSSLVLPLYLAIWLKPDRRKTAFIFLSLSLSLFPLSFLSPPRSHSKSISSVVLIWFLSSVGS